MGAMFPVVITFKLPQAEAAGLSRVHRDFSEAAKRIVRAALYRERRRQERIRFKQKQRAELAQRDEADAARRAGL